MRSLNRRQFFDQVVKVGGFAALFSMLPSYKILEMIGGKPEHAALKLRDWDVEADAATLPLNFVSTAPTVFPGADCRDGVTPLTVNALVSGDATAAGTDNTDTTFIKNGGSTNIKVTMSGGTPALTQLHHLGFGGVSVSMATIPTIGYRFYQPNVWDATAGNLILSNNGDASTNNFRYIINGLQFPTIPTHVHGWLYHQVHRKETTQTNGSPSYASTIESLFFQLRGVGGSSFVCYVDQFYYNGYQHPVIPWIFEGAPDTHYTVVFPAFTTKGMVGTLAIPTSLVDTTNFLTTAQIDEMYAAGWDVVHMSDTTTALTGLTVAAVETRLATAEAFMISKGWTRTLKHCVLPGSDSGVMRTDANAITALTNRGYLSACNKWADGTDGSLGVNPMGIDPIWGISLNPYRLHACRTENPDTTTEHLAHIDHAIAAGSPRILRTGSVAGSGVSGQMDSADFTTILAFLSLRHHAGTLTVAPWRKFYSGLSGRQAR